MTSGAACSVFAFMSVGQSAKVPVPAAHPEAVSSEKAMELAEQGHCKEAMKTLKRTVASGVDGEQRKRAGLLGVRCAMTTGDLANAEELLQLLGRAFPQDPEVLYVTVHAYSDLSTRAAQQLAAVAPESAEARKLNAESLELQGKWDEAAKQYEEILKKTPDARGIHFRLGRVYLSKPGGTPDEIALGKKELHEEVAIDPKNTAALYVLGEMARQESDWPEAIAQFSSAAKLDANFGDAFMGWGAALIAERKFDEAVAPLRQAARLQPGNTAAHYNLGLALLRSGKKEEADKEFAVQKRLLAEQEAEKNALVEGNKPQ
ncbi:MAG TPA: tetratricopeptide repeat protein [Candidatus Limnocylindrales bacterium]|nr:tetratricopeptide repeat protein [Candidatus Limnocylindrales bacterium]